MNITNLGTKSSAVKSSSVNMAQSVDKKIQQLQKQIAKVKIDTKLSDAEKAKKIKNIKAQMKKLKQEGLKSVAKPIQKTNNQTEMGSEKKKNMRPSIDITL